MAAQRVRIARVATLYPGARFLCPDTNKSRPERSFQIHRRSGLTDGAIRRRALVNRAPACGVKTELLPGPRGLPIL